MGIAGNEGLVLASGFKGIFYAYQIYDPLFFFFLIFDLKIAIEKCLGCFLVYPF